MEAIKSQLQNMGFNEAKVDKALKSCPDAQTLEQVMEWLIAHEEELNKEAAQSADKPKQTDDKASVSSESNPSSQTDQAAVGDDNKAKKLTVEEAQRLIQERQAQRVEEERKKAIEMEKKRRVEGQKMSEVRAELNDQDMINQAAAIRREKLEKEYAKKKVLEQIARDRENMRQRSNPKPLSEKSNPSGASKPQETRQSNECKIALRFADGTNLVHKFTPNEQLSAVRLYVQMEKKTDRLMEFVAPPNKKLTEEHMHETLEKLGLCPASRLEVKFTYAINDLD